MTLHEPYRTRHHVETILADRPTFDISGHANQVTAHKDLARLRLKPASTKSESFLDDSTEFIWGVRLPNHLR